MATLDRLPAEVIDEITQSVSFGDTCSLRLTNRNLEEKATSSAFKARFEEKNVEMTESGLRQFAQVVEHGSLSHRLKHLTLVAPFYQTNALSDEIDDGEIRTPSQLQVLGPNDMLEIVVARMSSTDKGRMESDLEELYEHEEELQILQKNNLDLALLGQAFSSLGKYGITLDTVVAELVLYQEDSATSMLPLYSPSEEIAWAAAAHHAKLILGLLTDGVLNVKHLNLFNSSRMVGTSLAVCDLGTINFNSSRSAVRKLESLSLSLSEEEQHLITTQEDRYGRACFRGFAQMLQSCENLRELDIADYCVECVEDIAERGPKQSRGILHALNQAELPKLQDLTLQGFYLDHNQLEAVLHRRRTVRKLTLRCICLVQGNLGEALDYFAQETGLEEIHLDSMFSPGRVQFEGPWVDDRVKDNPIRKGYDGLQAHWQRGGCDGTVQYKVFPNNDPPPHNAAARDWFQDLENWYGPPERLCSRARHLLQPEEMWRAEDF
ncbi:uncharacterized protein MYCGRDRAFT_108391 [Zymoseptoria tritici IPO323]|uniref:F-box domain-containing protein n=1 Tax=Zymoseptoria tritici (strain CBS 115943 / IPO323) TaxID=336722 RepID=F9X5D5_ZYMTI|nr:uncharacterized protein MYCGRDRAFT_108391 [Zymoseptoria tritici IPO323]EGP89645.1 hypothetical protein MYCGRDRAFT_108391 [Zymoseptoria tritici IPO323]